MFSIAMQLVSARRTFQHGIVVSRESVAERNVSNVPVRNVAIELGDCQSAVRDRL